MVDPQFVQHHALVEIGSDNLGQNVRGDVAAPAKVALDGALIDPEIVGGLCRIGES